MDNILVTIGSTTSAMRLARLLKAETRYRADVVHTPAVLNRGGCSYAIRTEAGAVEYLRRIAGQYHLPLQAVYRIEVVNGKCGYHALP